MTDTSQTDSQDSFEDLALAAKFRDTMTKHVIGLIDQQRPPLRKGTVTQIDPDILECRVSFNGADPVPVKMGAIQPKSVGQVVHVQGPPNDLWVVNIVGASALSEPDPTDFTAPQGFSVTGIIGGVHAQWNAVANAPRYEVNYADNPAFDDNISVFTQNTRYELLGKEPGTTYYVRVRVANQGDGRGPWSATQSANVLDYPGGDPSDGNPPASSPQPVVTSMLGAVIAEWIAVPNADLVHYDVYASNTSGFTAGPTNFIGSTTGTFYVIRTLNNGSPVPLGQNLFVRLIARDADGAAAVSAQGFAAPGYVNTGDVGQIDYGKIGDGQPPPSSPNTPLVHSGQGYLYVQWDHITNADPVMYEVHVSSASPTFFVNPNTFIGETPSNWSFIRTQGPGQNRDPLVYGTTYYVRLVAKDADGAADPGLAGSGFTHKVGTVDIYQGTITAESAILADLAVGSAKIQDAAITNLKVADAAISSAKIQDLAVGTAKITDLAVSTAKIQDLAVTNAKIENLSAAKITAGTIGAHTIVLNGVNSVLQSSNFSSGSAGWRIRGDGNFEANSGVFRGSLAAGVSISSPTITGGTISVANGDVVLDSSGLSLVPLASMPAFPDSSHDSRSVTWKSGSNIAAGIYAAGTNAYSNGVVKILANGGIQLDGSTAVTGTLSVSSSLAVGGSTVINSSRQFIGSSVNVSGGITAGSISGSGFLVGSTTVINPSGQFTGPGVSIGTNTVTCGAVNASGIITGSNRIRASFGALASPSFAATDNVNTGLNIASVGNIFLVASGTNRVGYNGSDVVMATTNNQSTAGTPFHSYLGAVRLFTSSAKLKTNIKDLPESVVLDLKPRTFTPTTSPEKLCVGFIAEEVAEADERLAVYGEDGEIQVYDERGLMAHIVKFLQSVDARLKVLEAA